MLFIMLRNMQGVSVMYMQKKRFKSLLIMDKHS